MIPLTLILLLALTGPCLTNKDIPTDIPLRDEKYYHRPITLSNEQIDKLAEQSNVTHLDEVLDNICVVRIVGTPEHEKVKDYIKKSMKDLGWSVETDVFKEHTPLFGSLTFENIIAKANPNAQRYLTLACHYDSKYTRERNFVGATDSAVPCAQMINLATVMKDQINSIKDKKVGLMFIFFDGEEAFKKWGPEDSIYGARHLAGIWHNNYTGYGREQNFSELDRMDMLVLLDLIGAPDPVFYSYFKETEKWYFVLMTAERTLANLKKFNSYSYGSSAQKYFQAYSMEANIEDDHIPFLTRDVPVLHLIPHPFPKVWHKSSDNRRNIDLKTTENISKILRVFVAFYLHIDV